MGVKGLWDIVSPSGLRIRPETLEGQVLAIDASIWLKQFLIGIKDGDGNTPQGAHLLGFFKRICKLLYYGIFPVVVFDGAPPEIKKRTLEQRRMQREMSEMNVRRMANKLLLNSIKLRVAKKIKSKVTSAGCGSDSELDTEDSRFKDEQDRESTDRDDGKMDLFSSESENGDDYVGGGLGIEGGSELNRNSGLFPVMGFLSERRRLDEMPEIDSNLFKMPISNNSMTKRVTRKLTNVEDFSAYMRKSSEIVDERRLTDLPLDTEIDPQVFEQLNSKLQYEILIQLRDAWLSSLRMSAVSNKDNMNQFCNSQMECYLRYLRINQEIEKLKLKMAKECEDQTKEQNLSADTDSNSRDHNSDSMNDVVELEGIRVAEYGEVCDPDELVNDLSTNGDGMNDVVSSEVEAKEGHCFNDNNSTLIDRICSYSANKLGYRDGIVDSTSKKDQDFYVISRKLTKKERVSYLNSTNYSNKEVSYSNPLNTSLFELEELLQKRKPEVRCKSKKTSIESSDELNNTQRIELLKENVDELFGSFDSKKSVQNILPSPEGDTNRNLDVLGAEEEETDDWKDIEWVNLDKEKNKSSHFETTSNDELFGDSIMSYLNSELDVILNSEPMEVCELKSISAQLEDSSSQGEIDDKDSKNPTISVEVESDAETQALFKSKTHQDELEPNFEKTGITIQGTQDENEEVGIEYRADKTAYNEQMGDEQEEKLEYKYTGSVSLDAEPLSPCKKVTTRIEKSQPETNTVIQSEDEDVLFKDFLMEDHYMEQLLTELEKEQNELNTKYKKQSVIMNSEITKEIKLQICMLLEAFGIPWIDSPGEAEAQASLLTKLNLCSGVLSDDSDCLIFGAKRVYRNFFSGTCTEMYDLDTVKEFLGIEKHEQMYILALLLGCDYTVGVNGIGPVNALEVLKAFPDLEDMVLFKNWSLNKLESDPESPRESAARAEFKRNHVNYRHSWVFPRDFPSLGAINAMRSPCVNHNFKPRFGSINKDSVIQIMTENTSLAQTRVSVIIDTIMRNQERIKGQTKIYDFLLNQNTKRKYKEDDGNIPSREEKVASIVSKRMKRALSKS